MEQGPVLATQGGSPRGSQGLPVQGVFGSWGPWRGAQPCTPSQLAHLGEPFPSQDIPAGHGRPVLSCPVLFSHPGAQHCPQPRTHSPRAPGLTVKGLLGSGWAVTL